MAYLVHVDSHLEASMRCCCLCSPSNSLLLILQDPPFHQSPAPSHPQSLPHSQWPNILFFGFPFPLAIECVFVLSLGPFFCFFLSSWVATGTGTTCLVSNKSNLRQHCCSLLPPLWCCDLLLFFSWLRCPLGRHTSPVLQGSHSSMNGTICSSTAAWQVLVLASHWQTSSRKGLPHRPGMEGMFRYSNG